MLSRRRALLRGNHPVALATANVRLVRAVFGDVTSVVARVALVFSERVVFLVDDDQAGSFSTGANTAERGPTAIRASPTRSRRRSS